MTNKLSYEDYCASIGTDPEREHFRMWVHFSNGTRTAQIKNDDQVNCTIYDYTLPDGTVLEPIEFNMTRASLQALPGSHLIVFSGEPTKEQRAISERLQRLKQESMSRPKLKMKRTGAAKELQRQFPHDRELSELDFSDLEPEPTEED